MDIDFAGPERHPFAGGIFGRGKRIRRRRSVEEDRDGLVTGPVANGLASRTSAISFAVRTITRTSRDMCAFNAASRADFTALSVLPLWNSKLPLAMKVRGDSKPSFSAMALRSAMRRTVPPIRFTPRSKAM